MYQIERLADHALIDVASWPAWVQGTWECGDRRFYDPDEDLYQKTGIGPCPVVDVPTFFMLFAPDEESGIRASTDATVKILVRRADDPRTLSIDLASGPVQQWVSYLTTTTPPLLAPARVAQILTGQQQ